MKTERSVRGLLLVCLGEASTDQADTGQRVVGNGDPQAGALPEPGFDLRAVCGGELRRALNLGIGDVLVDKVPDER
jgi:hypothetical protein